MTTVLLLTAVVAADVLVALELGSAEPGTIAAFACELDKEHSSTLAHALALASACTAWTLA